MIELFVIQHIFSVCSVQIPCYSISPQYRDILMIGTARIPVGS